MKSVQSHRTQDLAQTEIGTVSLFTGVGPNGDRQSHCAQGLGPNGDRQSHCAQSHRTHTGKQQHYMPGSKKTRPDTILSKSCFNSAFKLEYSPLPPHTNTHAMQRS